MYEKWVKAASEGQVSSAVFDLVSPSLLVQKMKIYGFEEDIIAWILSARTGTGGWTCGLS